MSISVGQISATAGNKKKDWNASQVAIAKNADLTFALPEFGYGRLKTLPKTDATFYDIFVAALLRKPKYTILHIWYTDSYKISQSYEVEHCPIEMHCQIPCQPLRPRAFPFRKQAESPLYRAENGQHTKQDLLTVDSRPLANVCKIRENKSNENLYNCWLSICYK